MYYYFLRLFITHDVSFFLKFNFQHKKTKYMSLLARECYEVFLAHRGGTRVMAETPEAPMESRAQTTIRWIQKLEGAVPPAATSRSWTHEPLPLSFLDCWVNNSQGEMSYGLAQLMTGHEEFDTFFVSDKPHLASLVCLLSGAQSSREKGQCYPQFRLLKSIQR